MGVLYPWQGLVDKHPGTYCAVLLKPLAHASPFLQEFLVRRHVAAQELVAGACAAAISCLFMIGGSNLDT